MYIAINLYPKKITYCMAKRKTILAYGRALLEPISLWEELMGLCDTLVIETQQRFNSANYVQSPIISIAHKNKMKIVEIHPSIWQAKILYPEVHEDIKTSKQFKMLKEIGKEKASLRTNGKNKIKNIDLADVINLSTYYYTQLKGTR